MSNSTAAMTLTPRFSAEYAPTLAEDGKFVRLDHADIAGIGYPESGAGKYAILTYAVQPEPAKVNSVFVMSSTYNAGVNFVYFKNYVQSIEVFNPTPNSTAYVLLSSQGGAADPQSAENNANSAVSLLGVPVIGSATSPGFYTINTETSGFYIETNIDSDLRVFGHYKRPGAV